MAAQSSNRSYSQKWRNPYSAPVHEMHKKGQFPKSSVMTIDNGLWVTGNRHLLPSHNPLILVFTPLFPPARHLTPIITSFPYAARANIR
jgi:hypothetical protein